MTTKPVSVIGLDIGTVRVGVARASWPDGIPAPLATIENGPSLMTELRKLISALDCKLIIAGKPRNMAGDDTPQTEYTLRLANEISQRLGLPIYYQDEAITSIKAEAELKQRRKPYTKSDIDSLSATFILEDFIHDHPKGEGVEL